MIDAAKSERETLCRFTTPTVRQHGRAVRTLPHTAGELVATTTQCTSGERRELGLGFVSLPSHAERAGNRIQFHVYKPGGHMFLNVTAYGNGSNNRDGAKGAWKRLLARNLWAGLARNIHRKYGV